MDSLKMLKRFSIFSEGFTETMAVQPVGGYMTNPVTLGWCKARPTVTFPA